MLVQDLLCRLQADLHQTWHEGRGQSRKVPWGIGSHGKLPVVMAAKKANFYGQIRIAVGRTLSMMSIGTSLLKYIEIL